MDITGWPVMASMCASCPFAEGGDEELRERVKARLLGGSQVCHHPRIAGRPETRLCRGARDFQLELLHRLGWLAAPTDEAWEAFAVEAREERR